MIKRAALPLLLLAIGAAYMALWLYWAVEALCGGAHNPLC